MILSDTEILKGMSQGDIVIDPFDRSSLGSNSYDVQLHPEIKTYRKEILDVRQNHALDSIIIPKEGMILYPGELYLGVTVEYTETHNFVPMLEGRSSIGRLGIDIHATAGVGDAGFQGYWTMEISVVKPVRVYAYLKIGQLIYHKVSGSVENPYNTKKSAKYNNRSKVPLGSRYYLSD